MHPSFVAVAPAAGVPIGLWRERLDRWLPKIAEVPAAALVLAEIVLLFAGVVSRYAFHRPLTWADELASVLFLWLVMFGSAIAMARNEHMRMTALVNTTKGGTRELLECFAIVVPLLFLGLVIGPGIDFAHDEVVITTPGLGMSSAWRAAALPVGTALMMLFALYRLVTTSRSRVAAGAVLLTLAVAAGFWFLGPTLRGLGTINLLIFFVGLVSVCVLGGVPIAFAFGLSTVSYLTLSAGVPAFVVVGRMEEGMSHLILLAVPMFVMLGVLLEMTGLATAMLNFLVSLLGHVRGGLSYVLVGAMYLVSGISGAKAADMAAIAPALFPEMKQRGQKPGELVALLAATGAQTETIPPSLVLITIGSVTGVSIAALFTGGLLPAALLGLLLCVVVFFRQRHEDLSHVRRAPWSAVFKTLLVALPALILPFVIRAAVVEGVATATEVSTIGIVYTCLVGLFVYRQFAWNRIYPMLVETASLSAAIIFIIGAATAMAWALTQSGFANELTQWMKQLPGGRITFLLVSIALFIVLGSLLEGIPAIVLFGPLLFPIAKLVGVDEVHYAIVVILAMGIGLFAPPVGIGYYAACAIGKVNPDEGVGPIWGYLAMLLLGTLIVAAVPWLTTGFLHRG